MTEPQDRLAREREEIATRVANFKATQEKFKREREEYFVDHAGKREALGAFTANARNRTVLIVRRPHCGDGRRLVIAVGLTQQSILFERTCCEDNGCLNEVGA